MNNDDDHQNDDNGGDEQNAAGNQTAKPAKKKRVRKQLSTVTKNKESLNAKLDTIPLPDPLFSKLNSIMGDVSSSNRLLLNILQTDTSSLKLTLDDRYWDASKCEPIEPADNFNQIYEESDMIDMPINLAIKSNQKIRQQLTGYAVTNTPIDDDEEESPQLTNNSFNQQIDYAFDINAEVEPEPDGDTYAMDYDLDGDGAADFDELTTEDRTAINACKGLRRATTIIEELRPSDTTKLEYSYRPMDNINQFWAGPSYWKFRKSRKLTMGTNVSSGTVVINAPANAPAAKRKKNKVDPKFVEDFENSDEEIDLTKFGDETIFINEKSKAGQKWKKTNLYKRWDSKKLKLPTDLRMDRSLFDGYNFAPGLRLQVNDPGATPQIQSDYDNAEDPIYGSPTVSIHILICS